MTRATKIILVLLTAGVGLWAYKIYNLANTLTFTTKKFSWNGSLTNPVINVTVSVKNNGQSSAKISNIKGNLCYKTGSTFEPVFFITDPDSKLLTPGASFDSDIILTPIQKAIDNGTLARSFSDFTGNIYFKGWVSVDNIPLPLNFNIA